ncbi:unnamed protein product [Polarella glacialis]|uniref:Uncharacterized protein n=1 Tax=Polarella glacialis TaxID=89957 RepID=A0A813HLU7_POLGL|nr:unnamed protein product [Polarella glacialis]CAE8681992.1 unnamed protein product [Polarella glacialis]
MAVPPGFDASIFPREVPMPLGLPAGWKAIERSYGPSAKSYGMTYIRYSSDCGAYKQLGSAKAVIKAHCEAKKLNKKDSAEFIKEYDRVREEDKKRKETERESRGKMGVEKREASVQIFQDKFGPLVGPVVFCFPGWTTRWEYSPNSYQTHVTYTDTEGTEWKLLKDLEAVFGLRIASGEGDSISKMIQDATARANKEEFAVGARSAREAEGVYEVTATGESSVRKREENLRNWRKKQKLEEIEGSRPSPDLLSWADSSASSEAGVHLAVEEFRKLLCERRKFPSSVDLLVVDGAMEGATFAPRMRGVYYKMQEVFADRPLYQRLVHVPAAHAGIACDGVYMMWSASKNRWQIATAPEESSPSFA